jgi:hypothetical protein
MEWVAGFAIIALAALPPTIRPCHPVEILVGR